MSKTINERFIAASDHPYNCRCSICLEWWKSCGPDPDSKRHGPFTDEEVNRTDEPTGMCPNCGGLCYNHASVCSDACGNEFAAYLNDEVGQ